MTQVRGGFMINRDFYLDCIIRNMWNGEVKVITGIRRCGKSTLLFDLFGDYLLKTKGVPEDHIIKLELDQRRHYKYRNPITLCEYVEDIVEYAFPFSFDVMEAAGDWHYGGNSPFSKEDMKNKKCPCLIIKKIDTDDWYFDNQDFSTLLGSKEDDVLKIYFNDDYEILDSKIKHFGGVYLGKGHMYE